MIKYVLWLPSWYPDRNTPYNGDFVQRHAKAVSKFHPVQVIYIVRDEAGSVTRKIFVEESKAGGLSEKIVYYYSPHFRIRFFDKLFSALKSRKLYKEAITDHFQKHGKPALVHVHVAVRTGHVARWIKKKFRIPYLLSEHWTGYLQEARDNFLNYPSYFKNSIGKTVKHSDGISVVSDYLGRSLEMIFGKIDYKVIPNVVDTDIFKPASSEFKQTGHFIHISGLDYQKDPEDILKAFGIVKQKGLSFHLTVVGPEREDLKNLAKELKINDSISFLSEMPQTELVKFMQRSDAFILYSRYETFGCVLVEANACGLPVIVSDIDVFHEIVSSNTNGIFVAKENPELLAEKLIWFLQNKQQFDHDKIMNRARQLYNFKKVGEQFSDWYSSVLKNS